MKTGIKRILRLTAVLLLASVLPGFQLSTQGAATGNIDVNDKFAWSETAGWLNFRPQDAGVKVYPDHLEGYAWAQNLGWIKLGTSTEGGNPAYSNTSATDWGVNHDGAGNLSGYAWSETAGWINFNPIDGQVAIDLNTGRFSGYAWAQNFGWIHFQNSDPVEYQVVMHRSEVTFSLAGFVVDENGDPIGDPVTVHRTNPYGVSEVQVELTDGTARGRTLTPLEYPADYEIRPLTVSFADGETEKTLSVRINDDIIDEPDETVNLAFHTPVNTGIGARWSGTLQIRDNDDPPAVAISDAVPTAEGDSGITDVDFKVTLSQESGKTVTVDYTTADDTATAGTDYTGQKTATPLTFIPGSTSRNIRVGVMGDLLDESEEETFLVNLSGPENATIAAGGDQATGTILDDDPEPTILVYDSAEVEGDGETTYLTFTVTLSGPSNKSITVDYATEDNTAKSAEGDYTPITTQTLTFEPGGETAQTIPVTITGDTEVEADETFYLRLSNPLNAEIGVDEVTGTIMDDDSSSFIHVDYSGSNGIDLEDAIIALRVLVGIDPEMDFSLDRDVNGNEKIDMTEVLYILQKVSGVRE